jgi:hypothetical protein
VFTVLTVLRSPVLRWSWSPNPSQTEAMLRSK